MPDEEMQTMGGQECPFCHEKTLSLTEQKKEVAYFGDVYLFIMSCESCKYHKADVEAAVEHEPSRYTLEIESEEDLKIRVIKSSEGTVKIPHVGSIEPGETSNGYITNVEGILNRIKHAI